MVLNDGRYEAARLLKIQSRFFHKNAVFHKNAGESNKKARQ